MSPQPEHFARLPAVVYLDNRPAADGLRPYAPSCDSDVIAVKRGETGFYPIQARVLADLLNEGISTAQREAMYAGSVHGWEVPAADPANYDVTGRFRLNAAAVTQAADAPVPPPVAMHANGERFALVMGQAVICNGYHGTVVRMVDGMVEVRVPGGITCVSASYPDCYPQPKAAIKQITLERVEGERAKVSVRTLADADAVLTQWAETCDPGGGYDKVSVTVEWDNGFGHGWRLDLTFGETPDLAADMAFMVAMGLGRAKPEDWTPAQYARVQERYRQQGLVEVLSRIDVDCEIRHPATRTVYCLAIEGEAVGGVDWFYAQADRDHAAEDRTEDEPFDLVVPGTATREQITALADDAAWRRERAPAMGA